jgi:hypothetical protein
MYRLTIVRVVYGRLCKCPKQKETQTTQISCKSQYINHHILAFDKKKPPYFYNSGINVEDLKQNKSSSLARSRCCFTSFIKSLCKLVSPLVEML